MIPFLQELLGHVEQYQQTQSEELTIDNFSFWLSQRIIHKEVSNNNKKIESKDNKYLEIERHIHEQYDGNMQLTFGIGMLYNALKFYSKKAMRDSELATLTDADFLGGVHYFGDVRKSELINLSLVEFSSGIEVIKRLLKKGFIEEFPDPNDKRSKRVRPTQKGIEEIERVMKEFDKVTALFSTSLKEAEKTELIFLLTKLNNFHAPIIQDERNSSLEDLLEKYL